MAQVSGSVMKRLIMTDFGKRLCSVIDQTDASERTVLKRRYTVRQMQREGIFNSKQLQGRISTCKRSRKRKTDNLVKALVMLNLLAVKS